MATSREDLIAAILRDRDEDTPRLAYADWLDEFGDAYQECPVCKRPADAKNHVTGHIFVGWGHGWQPCSECDGTARVPSRDRERAELIRVSIEAYRLAHGWKQVVRRKEMTEEEVVERFDALGRRELALATRIYRPALPDDYTIATVVDGGLTSAERMKTAYNLDATRSVAISRGFVVRLTLDMKGWRLAWSFRREPVRSVKILENSVGVAPSPHWRATPSLAGWAEEFSDLFANGRIPWSVFQAGVEAGKKDMLSPPRPHVAADDIVWQIKDFTSVRAARKWLSEALIAWSRTTERIELHQQSPPID